MNDQQSDNKRGRKPSVPNIDRVVDAIVTGAYDPEFWKLSGAIQKRRDAMKQDVLERVRMVYGANAKVVTDDDGTDYAVRPNPFIEKKHLEDDKQDESALAFFRINPSDGNAYKIEKLDIRKDQPGTITITDVFGGHQMDVPYDEWMKWEKASAQDSDDVITPDPLSDLDEVERHLNAGEKVPIEQRGAIISGLSASDMGN